MASTVKPFVDNDPGNPNNQVAAADVNGFKNENTNLIIGAGLTPDALDNEQTHEAVAIYASGGDYYIDSGAADAYVLSTFGSKIAPPVYFEGMNVKFIPGNNNTGASTVNVATLGVQNIKVLDGATAKRDPIAGEIIADIETRLYYDGVDFVIANTKIGQAKAWCVFEVLEVPPGQIVLHSVYNIASITEVSAGLYEITFSKAFTTDEDFVIPVGNVVIKDEAINFLGNDNMIIFQLISNTVIRVNVYDQGIDANERPERVSLIFMGAE